MKLPKLTAEETERGSRKPFPKTFRAWAAEVEGIEAFIKKRPQLRDTNGQKWLNTMQAYHRARLVCLVENPPPILTKASANALASDILKRLG